MDKKYQVEICIARFNTGGVWDDYYGDYIEAKNATEAIDLFLTWCVENGAEEMVNELTKYEIRARQIDGENNEWEYGNEIL